LPVLDAEPGSDSGAEPLSARSSPMPRSAALFARALRDERGSLTVFGLFIFVLMLMVGGLAVDLMRFETERVRLQNTLDRSVLAAASLNQMQGRKAVVSEYFAKAGLAGSLGEVDVDEGLNHRKVTAAAATPVKTLFMSMMGISELTAPAFSQARENRLDVEISLVLDVSGSMDSNQRLPRLKTAAKQFVDALLVQKDHDRDRVSISIVPFSMQVSAGAEILSFFDVSAEHGYSNCVDFAPAAFQSTAVAANSVLKRTGHFDPLSSSVTPTDFVCRVPPSREILAFSNDSAALKAKIDSFTAGGNTSIEIGAKWGLFLLDPSSQPIATARIAAGKTDADFAGRPVAYTEPETLKVLIVMSDGANTDQYMLKDAYNSGLSDVFRDPGTGRFSIYDAGRIGDQYWVLDSTTGLTGSWQAQPYRSGTAAAVQLTYPELWNAVPLKTYNTLRSSIPERSSSFDWNTVVTRVQTGTKNTRTSQICSAAKAAKVEVFTIAFETSGAGQATLRDCATAPVERHFFDVNGLQISEAFSTIASQINQLRLSQ
jgi:Flp pilus assembly protein TadG